MTTGTKLAGVLGSTCFRYAAAALVAFWCAWLIPRSGLAQDAPKIAIHLEGTGAPKYRAMIEEIVPEGVEVIEKNKFTRALMMSGLTGGRMGFTITSKGRMRQAVIKFTARAVKKEKLAGAIIGRTKAGRKGLELVLLWVEESGETPIDESVSLKGDAKANLEAALGAKLEEIAPKKEEPKPDPVEKPPPPPGTTTTMTMMTTTMTTTTSLSRTFPARSCSTSTSAPTSAVASSATRNRRPTRTTCANTTSSVCRRSTSPVRCTPRPPPALHS